MRRYGFRPLARGHTMAVVGSDPVFMLTGPIPATEAVLRRSGLGLGLFISRQIISRHGGQISVTSTPGSGSRFVVEIPSWIEPPLQA